MDFSKGSHQAALKCGGSFQGRGRKAGGKSGLETLPSGCRCLLEKLKRPDFIRESDIGETACFKVESLGLWWRC